MRGHWIGPMPVQDFLHAFLTIPSGTPPPPQKPNLFRELKVPDTEKEMCGPFIEAVSESNLNLIPGFKIVDTSSHPDQESRQGKKIEPDPSMYRSDLDTSAQVTQFDKELHFQFKLHDSDDPFWDPTPSDIDGSVWNFAPEYNWEKNCRGQLKAYAAEWCSRQHRTFAFTVFIFGSSARLIRWDRSAAVVTEMFDYKANSQPLVDFLWYFTRLDDAARGKDNTVREANEEETKLAHDVLDKWKPAKERSVVVFTIQVDKKKREFLGWGSMADGESLMGRATRAYPVWDVQEQDIRFLKDSWREVHSERESDILRMLNEAGVRNVPQFICGGDIEDKNHTTRSHSFANNLLVGINGQSGLKWASGTPTIAQRIHHRFVSKEIGSHLVEFKNSKHLMQVTYDAFIGHRDAYEKCGVLHRDVSANNIMIKNDGTGFLNDWDLAKRVTKDAEEVSGKHERTGTWQFISTLNLIKPGKAHNAQDDMESFFHVVLYYGLKHLKHTPILARETMIEIFDKYLEGPKGTYTGGEAKLSMFLHRRYIKHNFEFTGNAPLNVWFNFAIRAFRQWINYMMPPQPDELPVDFLDFLDNCDIILPQTQPTPIDPSTLFLKDHEQLRKWWEKLLKQRGWPDDDKTADQVPPITNALSENSSKRPRDEASQTESSHKKRIKS